MFVITLLTKLAENTADSDISISSPCGHEPSDSSSDSYSYARYSGPGIAEPNFSSVKVMP